VFLWNSGFRTVPADLHGSSEKGLQPDQSPNGRNCSDWLKACGPRKPSDWLKACGPQKPSDRLKFACGPQKPSGRLKYVCRPLKFSNWLKVNCRPLKCSDWLKVNCRPLKSSDWLKFACGPQKPPDWLKVNWRRWSLLSTAWRKSGFVIPNSALNKREFFLLKTENRWSGSSGGSHWGLGEIILRGVLGVVRKFMRGGVLYFLVIAFLWPSFSKPYSLPDTNKFESIYKV